MMELIIKDTTESKTGIKVIQKDEIFETYNKLGQLICYLDFTKVEHEGYFIIRYIGTIEDDEIMEILDGFFMEEIVKRKCPKQISDNSQLNGSWDGVNKWLAEYLVPKAIEKAGLKYHALVLSNSIFTQFSGEQFENHNQSLFQNRLFGSEVDAVKWLRSI